jgi:hypothetical protein
MQAIQQTLYGDVVLMSGNYNGYGNYNLQPEYSVSISSIDGLLDCQRLSVSALGLSHNFGPTELIHLLVLIWFFLDISSIIMPSFLLQGISFLNCENTALVISQVAVTIADCEFSTNSGYLGGALSIGSNATVTVSNCSFSYNSAYVLLLLSLSFFH